MNLKLIKNYAPFPHLISCFINSYNLSSITRSNWVNKSIKRDEIKFCIELTADDWPLFVVRGSATGNTFDIPRSFVIPEYAVARFDVHTCHIATWLRYKQRQSYPFSLNDAFNTTDDQLRQAFAISVSESATVKKRKAILCAPIEREESQERLLPLHCYTTIIRWEKPVWNSCAHLYSLKPTNACSANTQAQGVLRELNRFLSDSWRRHFGTHTVV